MPKPILLAVLFTVLSLCLYAQKLNIKKGQQFSYDIEEHWSVGNYKGDKFMVLDYKVLEKKDTSYVFEGRFRNIVHDEANEYMIARLNTANLSDNSNINNTTAFIPEIALLNEPFRFTISQNLYNLDVTDINRILDSKIKRWQIGPEMALPLRENTLGFAKIVLLFTLFKVPDDVKPVSGASWTDTAIRRTYTINTDKNMVRITGKRSVGDGLYNEESIIDLNSGMLISKNTNLKEDLVFNNEKLLSNRSLNVKKSGNKKFSVEAPEAWDMLMKGAFFSDALKTNLEIDSAKVIGYIKTYPQFNNQRIYVTNKLSLLQRINNYDLYQSELKKTPSNLIAGSHHLHNRINDDDVSVDSAVYMAKLIDDNGAYGWLQHSYAHRFIQANGKRYEDGLQTLKQLSDDNKMKFYTTPLYYWATVKEPKAMNSDYNAMAEKLLLLDDDYWEKGNAGRYAILMAQELTNTGKFTESKNVLDKTIQKLDALYKDNTSPRRMIHKMLLAHAWYQQYLVAEKNKATADRLSYLEKAAFYSPKGQKEKAYDSWYDNVFIKGEENYTNKYLEQLALSGKQDQVLNKYVSEFTTTPSSLYDVKDFTGNTILENLSVNFLPKIYCQP